MSDSGDNARSTGWLRRRATTTDRLQFWTPDEWFEWFADGLDIWFSDYPRKDRSLAFAPLSINVDREEPVAKLANYLKRVVRSATTADAALPLRYRIQEAAIRCLRSSVIIRTAERAEFILELFVAMEETRLPEMARLSLQRLAHKEFADDDMESYISLLCYIIFDNDVLGEKEPLRNHLEDRLRTSPNFRPALFYSLQLSDSDVMLCLTRFYELTRGQIMLDDDGVWKVVSEEFDTRFGRTAVAAAIKTTISDSRDGQADLSDAFAPASRLSQYYPGAEEGGLWSVHESGGIDNTRAMGLRDILAVS